MSPALLEAFRRGLSCQPESGHCDVGCDACLTNALKAFDAARDRDIMRKPLEVRIVQETGELLDATEPLCREMTGILKHRVYVREDGMRYIIRNGEWCSVHNRTHMTGAKEPGTGPLTLGSGLHRQWPAVHIEDDCVAMLDVWRRPVAVVAR